MSSKTQSILERLRQFESRNVTYLKPDGSWPIVWQRAQGTDVWDVEGRKYLDLTAAFGVAAAGHANRRVVKAGQEQMATLLHAMGDVHPHPLKALLARELSRITFERWRAPAAGARRTRKPALTAGKSIFCSSGFEAVEAALKTAFLATGQRGVLAFRGGYHGLGYGALNATHRDHFRKPFLKQLGKFGSFLPFPTSLEALSALEPALAKRLAKKDLGAILVEPIQTRGGINVPPPEFLGRLRQLCDQHDAVLILDEIYTGFGRTGAWFACEHSSVIPDLICLGKALTGGFPLSACVGNANLMDKAWPASTGEAIHTSTFLGHPVGCAMALAQIAEIEKEGLVARAADLGQRLVERLRQLDLPRALKSQVRGLGLLVGLELQAADGRAATNEVLGLVETMLHRGFILLPEGERANVLSFSPPLTITEKQLNRAVSVLQTSLNCLEVGLLR